MKKYIIFLNIILTVITLSVIGFQTTVLSANNASDFTYTIADYGVIITKYKGTAENVVIPPEIEGIPVVEIGREAFYNCDTLRELILPTGIITIGTNAFYRCDNLKEVIIPEGVLTIKARAFKDCPSLLQINLPESLLRIENSAFEICQGVTDIHLGSNLEYIGDIAFGDCWALKSINEIPESVTYLGIGLFQSDRKLVSEITIPYSITEIPNSIFLGCESLTKINLHENITKIGKASFFGCHSLKNFNIPNNITVIGDSAFMNSRLKNIVLSNGLIEIGKEAFVGCDFNEIIVPESVQIIKLDAFKECENLKKAIIKNDNVIIDEHAFGYYFWYDYVLYDDFVLYGNTGSTSEIYATDNNIPFLELNTINVNILLGDVNCNGEINTADVILLAKAICNRVVLTEEQKINANIDGITGASSDNLLLIIKYLIGEIDSLPQQLLTY